MKGNSGDSLPKTASGIRGFDEITLGGLPKGRPTLICGGAGSGKTLFGMECLVRGAVEFDEPGVFISFEETEADLVANFKSLGFDLEGLAKANKIYVDYVRIEKNEIEETGEYDLEGLFVRIQYAIDSINAKRIVLDTMEALFAGLSNEGILRSEIRRLFQWLKERGITAVITAERPGGEGITRHGLEEFVSDCVVILDHRVQDQISVRRMRIAKYRGSYHGTNEYPFLIDTGGFSVLPITSVGLDYDVSSDRISTGISDLDRMLGGDGFYRGASVLVSGEAGTGKSSMAAHLVDQACRKGRKCIYYSFEESSSQIIRNMRSIGIDLTRWIEKGNLVIESQRPSFWGLEMHLVNFYKEISDKTPDVVVIDPITGLLGSGTSAQVKSILLRLVDLLKSRLITTFFTALIDPGCDYEEARVGISSIMDSWISLQEIKVECQRKRVLSIVKSRGMAHSIAVRELTFTDKGIKLSELQS